MTGSPTEGFLGHVAVGPFDDTFQSWAGDAWADWLFMLGLAGIGVAVILGVGPSAGRHRLALGGASPVPVTVRRIGPRMP